MDIIVPVPMPLHTLVSQTCIQTQNEHARHTVHLEVVYQTNRKLVTGYHSDSEW